MRPGAIVIGASSGIGESLALALSHEGYRLGLAARRKPLLDQVRDRLNGEAFTIVLDVSDRTRAEAGFNALVERLGDVDLVIICAGVGHLNPDLDVGLEIETVDVNVVGFTLVADAAARYFEARGSGHLVGISSVSGLRGSPHAPAYSASKGFISNYLEALRLRARRRKMPLFVTDVRPGLVDTRMAQGQGQFWVAPPARAAGQILRAIKAKRSVVYVTRRWRLIAWLTRILPASLYCRL